MKTRFCLTTHISSIIVGIKKQRNDWILYYRHATIAFLKRDNQYLWEAKSLQA